MSNLEQNEKQDDKPNMDWNPGAPPDRKHWMETLAFYLMATAFILIFFAAVFIIGSRYGYLRYANFVFNPDLFGNYLLYAGVASYVIGRGLKIWHQYSFKEKTE